MCDERKRANAERSDAFDPQREHEAVIELIREFAETH
jgi:hypothetical protein